MHDTIIIGAGPAGMTAAIYASRRAMRTLVIAKDIGGQLQWASEIENYPGFKSIAGLELISRMKEQVAALGVPVNSEEVRDISTSVDEGGMKKFTVTTAKRRYEARTVIIAMGLAPRRLAIPGEQEFAGKGVSYCANCDGPFFKGKTVSVVGGGNAALDAAEVLSKIASEVFLVHRGDAFRGFEALVEEIKSRKNIKLLMNSEIKEINGVGKVASAKVKNSRTGAEQEIALDGVFIEIGRIAHTDFLDGVVDRNERSQVIIDAKCRTSQDGIFAAGDVADGEFKQITIACGQATVAALSAYQYIQLKKGQSPAPVLDRGKNP